MIARLTTVAVALVLLAGCCSCRRDVAQIAREIDSVLVRTEPNWRLTAAQQEKLLRDEETLRADVAALASCR